MSDAGSGQPTLTGRAENRRRDGFNSSGVFLPDRANVGQPPTSAFASAASGVLK